MPQLDSIYLLQQYFLILLYFYLIYCLVSYGILPLLLRDVVLRALKYNLKKITEKSTYCNIALTKVFCGFLTINFLSSRKSIYRLFLQ